MRVLVSAYACEPGRGSEPGVGWSWVREIARFNEVWVVTRANNRPLIEAALGASALSSLHWVYFDLPPWLRFWKRRGFGVRLYYLLWQIGLYFVARRLHKQNNLELIHHLTFGTYWMPTFLALLPVPFVWGPLGGGESAPPAFRRFFGQRARLYEVMRDAIRTIGELNPLLRFTARRAILTLCKTVDTEKRLQRLGARRTLVYSEVGLPEADIQRLNNLSSREESAVRLVSLGRLIHWKGFELAVNAFAKFHRAFPESEYWIIGDGPERRRLEALAQRLGVADSVRFFGGMSRAHVLQSLESCDVLVHPSLHDSGGWVCVEAMASGRPVICLDLGGPAIQVTHETGIKVRATTPQQVILDLAQAMSQLAQDGRRRHHLGQAGRRRVQEHFSWHSKGQWIKELFLAIKTIEA